MVVWVGWVGLFIVLGCGVVGCFDAALIGLFSCAALCSWLFDVRLVLVGLWVDAWIVVICVFRACCLVRLGTWF